MLTKHDRSHAWAISAFGDEIAPELEQQVETLAAHDVRHVEFRSAWGINVVDLNAEQLSRASRVLEAAGMGVSAIGSPVGKAPIEGEFAQELSRLRTALAAADRLGTSLVRVFSFYVPDGCYRDHRDEVLRRMSALAREADVNAVTLVHENESYIYGDTAERCRDLIDGVASPALRLAFDPANFVQVGVRPCSHAWPLLADVVVHFHVKDAVAVDRTGLVPYPARVPDDRLMDSVRVPGQGEGELKPLLQGLDLRGYDGFLTIEPHLAWRMPEHSGAERFAVAVGALRALTGELQGAEGRC